MEGMAWPTVDTTLVAKRFKRFTPDGPIEEACHKLVRIWHVFFFFFFFSGFEVATSRERPLATRVDTVGEAL